MTDKTLNEVYLSRIEKLKKEKAELLEALKNIVPYVAALGSPGMSAAVNAAKTAIENAEKKEQ